MKLLRFLKVCSICILAMLALLATGFSEQRMVLRAERMLDVSSGKIINNVYVAVEGQKIAALGGAELSKGAKQIKMVATAGSHS